MLLSETTLPEPNHIAQITLKPKIHTSQLIATANQKISLEVTVLEVTRHRKNRTPKQKFLRRYENKQSS